MKEMQAEVVMVQMEVGFWTIQAATMTTKDDLQTRGAPRSTHSQATKTCGCSISSSKVALCLCKLVNS